MNYSAGTLVLLYLLYYVAISAVIVEEESTYKSGIYGVSAFSSSAFSSMHSSSVLSPLRPYPKPTIAGVASIRKTTTIVQSKGSKRNQKNGDADEKMSTTQSPVTDVRGPFVLLLASQFLLFIGVGAVIPSIPLYGKEIGLSGAANGIVISAPAVALFLVANWSGRRADIARKPAMMIGMAVIAVSDIGTALAQGIYTLVLARLGLGAGRSLSEAGERGMLVDLANQIPELRGRALAAQQAAVALGIAIGAPAGGVVVERYGPRAAFFCVSVAAIVALILYAFLPETKARSSTTTTTTTTAIADGCDNIDNSQDTLLNENTSGLKVWAELLKQNEWRGLALCQSGVSFGYAAKIASIPILATSTLPGGAVGAGALLSAAGLSGLVGAPIGGYITDKIGAKGTAIISGAISGLGLILVPVALFMAESMNGDPSLSSYYPYNMEVAIGNVMLDSKALFFSLAVLLWSLGVSAQGPALTALAQEKSLLGVEATSFSFVKAAGDGTYIIAPFLLGLVTDDFSDYPGIECALAGSMMLLGTIALTILVQGNDTK
uniref:Major facilitator superfamily (MFS) profile domain-containing protein n=1 Tax=Pseudo-nitzschia australis TaxID=44445 RepID=A0A7S4EPX9_9STRA|mmetsp:Transcript_17598/g.38453  ORF Transcript_17598/g.38453 Transcript_17598/m.38453 type:complete len:549 (+) Transcript_17598:115-1761(+)